MMRATDRQRCVSTAQYFTNRTQQALAAAYRCCTVKHINLCRTETNRAHVNGTAAMHSSLAAVLLDFILCAISIQMMTLLIQRAL
jgi:hypothetical protein